MSHSVIIVEEVDVPRTLRVSPHKFLVTWGSLVLDVPRQHALYAHADTLHVLHRAPALTAEKVKADDAIGVDVRVDRDWAFWGEDEGHLWCFCFRDNYGLREMDREQRGRQRECRIPMG